MMSLILRPVLFLLVVAIHVALVLMLSAKHHHGALIATDPFRVLQYVVISPTPELPRPRSITSQSPQPMRKAASVTSIPTTTQHADATPSNETSTLDLDALHAGILAQDRGQSRTPLGIQSTPQTLEARLGKEIKKAARSDCKTAYAHTGLLAPIFMTADWLREKGCRF